MVELATSYRTAAASHVDILVAGTKLEHKLGAASVLVTVQNMALRGLVARSAFDTWEKVSALAVGEAESMKSAGANTVALWSKGQDSTIEGAGLSKGQVREGLDFVASLAFLKSPISLDSPSGWTSLSDLWEDFYSVVVKGGGDAFDSAPSLYVLKASQFARFVSQKGAGATGRGNAPKVIVGDDNVARRFTASTKPGNVGKIGGVLSASVTRASETAKKNEEAETVKRFARIAKAKLVGDAEGATVQLDTVRAMSAEARADLIFMCQEIDLRNVNGSQKKK